MTAKPRSSSPEYSWLRRYCAGFLLTSLFWGALGCQSAQADEPAGGDDALLAFDEALQRASADLESPRRAAAQPHFDLRIAIDAEGRLSHLDVVDPALAPLQSQWAKALSRHQPFPVPRAGAASYAVRVRFHQISIVRGSLRLVSASGTAEGELRRETALLTHQLEDLSTCEAPKRRAQPGAVRSLIEGVTLQFEASGAVAALQGLPAEQPAALCLDQHLRALRLPSSREARSFRISFAIESGPPRVQLAVNFAAAARPAIKEQLAEHEPAVRACRGSEAKQDPQVGGRMTARLIIDDRGSVALATTSSSTLKSERVEACTLSVLRSLRFPPLPKGRFIQVSHPILFGLELPPGVASSAELAAFENRWITMSSEHFVLYTEGGLSVAQRALEEAERAYAALRAALSIHIDVGPDSQRLMMVVVSSSGLYNLFAPLKTSGIFRRALRLGESDIVFLRGVGHFSVLRHELVHNFLHGLLPTPPAWLDEGLAQYYEWTETDEDSVVVGISAATRAYRRLASDSPYSDPIPMLLTRAEREFLGPQSIGLYSSAFWLTAALISSPSYRPRLNRYIARMARGIAQPAAWMEAFGDVDLPLLERDRQAEAARAEAVTYQLAVRLPVPRLNPPRALTNAEGHTLTARLLGAARSADARQALNKALELDPQQAEAWARRALLPSPAGERWTDAERATSLDPTSQLGWMALGLSLLADKRGQHGERAPEIAKRLAAFRDSADSQCVAAMLLESCDQDAAALAAARAAVRLAPLSFPAQAALARIAAHLGRSAEAQEARARAYALASESADPAVLDAILAPAPPRKRAGARPPEPRAN